MIAAEATANTVLGLLIGCAILRAYGLPASDSLVLQGVFVLASWGRSYAVRWAFARWT